MPGREGLPVRATWPRLDLGTVPWLLALAGIVVPLAGSGFVTWPISLGWLGALVRVWMGGGPVVPTRSHRIGAALLLLLVLVVLGGGSAAGG
jgi:hypothetical protein